MQLRGRARIVAKFIVAGFLIVVVNRIAWVFELRWLFHSSALAAGALTMWLGGVFLFTPPRKRSYDDEQDQDELGGCAPFVGIGFLLGGAVTIVGVIWNMLKPLR